MWCACAHWRCRKIDKGASNRVYRIGEVDRPAIEAPPDVRDLNAGLK
jgi:hypothetical protein